MRRAIARPALPVKVWVTISDESEGATNRGQRTADALEKIAQSHGLAGVDGAQWQRAVWVQCLIQGARFSSTGLGWGVSKVIDPSVKTEK